MIRLSSSFRTFRIQPEEGNGERRTRIAPSDNGVARQIRYAQRIAISDCSGGEQVPAVPRVPPGSFLLPPTGSHLGQASPRFAKLSAKKAPNPRSHAIFSRASAGRAPYEPPPIPTAISSTASKRANKTRDAIIGGVPR